MTSIPYVETDLAEWLGVTRAVLARVRKELELVPVAPKPVTLAGWQVELVLESLFPEKNSAELMRFLEKKAEARDVQTAVVEGQQWRNKTVLRVRLEALGDVVLVRVKDNREWRRGARLRIVRQSEVWWELDPEWPMGDVRRAKKKRGVMGGAL
jgi:hypothetical protein